MNRRNVLKSAIGLLCCSGGTSLSVAPKSNVLWLVFKGPGGKPENIYKGDTIIMIIPDHAPDDKVGLLDMDVLELPHGATAFVSILQHDPVKREWGPGTGLNRMRKYVLE